MITESQKGKLKARAKRLRRGTHLKPGMTVGDISATIGVSKGVVREWLVGIPQFNPPKLSGWAEEDTVFIGTGRGRATVSYHSTEMCQRFKHAREMRKRNHPKAIGMRSPSLAYVRAAGKQPCEYCWTID